MPENDNQPARPNIYLPLIFAILLVTGVFIGTKIDYRSNNSGKGNDKINSLLDYIQAEYVDTISREKLVELTISDMLQSLDPHSAYIPADELKAMNEPLQGNFSGIGIEFNIIKDTIRVVSVLAGGPSEALGIQPGDRIVKIEGKNSAGIKITNSDVLKLLRGESGTKVNISIQREGTKKLINYEITRGEIPIYSVEVAYMAAPQVGYIKISRFAATTYEEYMKALEKLKSEGMTKLILDLRNNPGGFLNAAVDVADDFLPANKMIVYTMGKSHPRTEYKATKKGSFENNQVEILIDEGSASASEILAGAIQDNDRGIIIGRRSFGKGLVQQQSEFPDGSALRLTIARYYTPTGRSIQRPYSAGSEAYYQEDQDRFLHGELLSADSIKFPDSLKFKTPAGKIVYGGGGIMPDIFIPIDTSGHSNWLNEINYKNIIGQFAFYYSDRERAKLKAYRTFSNFNRSFLVTNELLNELVVYAENNGVKKNEREIELSEKIIKVQLKALIARNIWHNEGFYPVIQTLDETLKRAIEEFR
jgi:carboxyl-terminal processing protease